MERNQWPFSPKYALKALSPAGLALVHSWQGRPVELRQMPVLIGSLIELLHGPQGLQAAPIQGLEGTLNLLQKG